MAEDGGEPTFTQERTCYKIQLVQNHPADMVSSRGKVRKNISPREQCVAQCALSAYVASMPQPEAAFDVSFADRYIIKIALPHAAKLC